MPHRNSFLWWKRLFGAPDDSVKHFPVVHRAYRGLLFFRIYPMQAFQLSADLTTSTVIWFYSIGCPWKTSEHPLPQLDYWPWQLDSGVPRTNLRRIPKKSAVTGWLWTSRRLDVYDDTVYCTCGITTSDDLRRPRSRVVLGIIVLIQCIDGEHPKNGSAGQALEIITFLFLRLWPILRAPEKAQFNHQGYGCREPRTSELLHWPSETQL
jgi:hypothetical protein